MGICLALVGLVYSYPKIIHYQEEADDSLGHYDGHQAALQGHALLQAGHNDAGLEEKAYELEEGHHHEDYYVR